MRALSAGQRDVDPAPAAGDTARGAHSLLLSPLSKCVCVCVCVQAPTRRVMHMPIVISVRVARPYAENSWSSACSSERSLPADSACSMCSRSTRARVGACRRQESRDTGTAFSLPSAAVRPGAWLWTGQQEPTRAPRSLSLHHRPSLSPAPPTRCPHLPPPAAKRRWRMQMARRARRERSLLCGTVSPGR